MDCFPLSNDQLVDLARAICAEASARGAATYAAYSEATAAAAAATTTATSTATSAPKQVRNVKIMNGKTSDGAPICMVRSPYSTLFVSRVKAMGATWNKEKGWWRFQPAVKEEVALLCLNVYGERGDETAVDYVNLDVRFPDGESEFNAPVEYAGRVIARAFGRDSGAKLGEKIAFLAGGATSGGSVKNWRTEVKAGSVVRIIDVPRQFAQSLAQSRPETVTVVEP